MEIYAAGFLPEALLIDLPEIDAQHEEIFNRIEALKIGCFESSYVPVDEFSALLDYFAIHFATEERIADQAGLDFTQHARVHADTLRLLHKALAEVLSGGQDVHSFLRYAVYWFERHINEDDRLFSTTLQSMNFGLPGGLRHNATVGFAAQV